MSESATHMKLVVSLVQWIADKYFDGDVGRILADQPTCNAGQKPPMVGGYVPDAFARVISGTGFIIGDAKTSRDLESRHTRDQLSAFLGQCSREENSAFVLAVPWHLSRYARSLLEHLKARNGISNVATFVLDQLDG